MKYLGIEPQKPKIAVFDFTSCQGCELQLANEEATLVDFLGAIEIVRFREVSSAAADDYDIALIEGAISRDDEVQRLEAIRARAKVLVAFGSCACFGGVNRLKNDYDLAEANREVYGDMPKETSATRSVEEVVKVDLRIPGCPVSKPEIERLVRHLVLGVPADAPTYPVCWECKQRFTVCLVPQGKLCLGPITFGGCNAPCPAAGLGCWGCRGPAMDANQQQFELSARELGFSEEELHERLNMYGGFTAASPEGAK